MVRARKGAACRQAKRRLFKAVKGYVGGRRKQLRTAKVAILRSRQFSYRDRKNRKRNLRRLWIIRINAACRARGSRYNRFIHGLQSARIELNRKMLAHVAATDPAAFDKLVELAQSEPARV